MRPFLSQVKLFVAQDEGATMVEYGLMVALIAIACVGAIAIVGTKLSGLFSGVATSVGGT